MRRMPITYRITSFNRPRCRGLCYGVLGQISLGYPPVSGRLHTCYSPVRRSPSGGIATAYAAPRLACVKPVASVHPEPGSNSSLLIYLIFVRSRFCTCRKEQNRLFGAATIYILYIRWRRRNSTECLNPDSSSDLLRFSYNLIEKNLNDGNNLPYSCTTIALSFHSKQFVSQTFQ